MWFMGAQPMEKKSNERRTVNKRTRLSSRRRFLQGLGAAGLGVGFSEGALAEEDEKVRRVEKYVHTNHEEVIHGAAPIREPKYYYISRERWARVESAHNAAERIEKRLAKKFDPQSFSVSVQLTNDSTGGRRRGVSVEFITVENPDGSVIEPNTTFGTFSQELPDRVTGVAGRKTEHETEIQDIPVEVEKITEYPEVYFSTKYDDVPAGAHCQTEPVAGFIYNGTTGTPATNSTSENVLVTCGHNYDLNNNGTLNASELHQDDYNYYNGDFVGYVDSYDADPDYDMAIIGIDASNRDVQWDIANNSGGVRGYQIYGILAKDYLKDNLGETLYKQGSATGNVTGSIEKVGSTFIKIDASNSSGGDSGGPYYDYGCSIGGCSSYIAAIHRGTAGDGLQKGTLMESIEDNENVTV